MWKVIGRGQSGSFLHFFGVLLEGFMIQNFERCQNFKMWPYFFFFFQSHKTPVPQKTGPLPGPPSASAVHQTDISTSVCMYTVHYSHMYLRCSCSCSGTVLYIRTYISTYPIGSLLHCTGCPNSNSTYRSQKVTPHETKVSE